MTSLDELFKGTATGSVKRKFEAPDAQQVYKATKVSSNSSPNSNGATVEDADDDDREAGPVLPPDDGEDGRFFDDGVTADTAEALRYLDQQDGEEEPAAAERIDSAWLRRLTLTFEKKVAKNAELRARYDGEPQKFMASEADLDAEIKSWSLLSEHPELYNQFAESDAAALVVGLLAHENTDIAIGAIEIVSELLDEDVETDEEQWNALVTSLLEADLLELLASNLGRLNEEDDNESDRSGVFHSLAVLENLASQRAIAEKIGEGKILQWLCNRIRHPEGNPPVGQNKQYAAEVLQVLLQSSPKIRKTLAVDLDGVETLLQLLSVYRKRDPPKDSHEEEYAENLFDALTCIVEEPDGKSKFVEAEGVELCLIMMREGTMSKIRAIRLLDHAATGNGPRSIEVCEKVVEAAGLKTLFGLFGKKTTDNTTTEHLLGIFASLLRSLPGDSAFRIRTIAKFLEKDGQKLDRLIQVRLEYLRKVGTTDGGAVSEATETALFCVQTIDVSLAWLCAEDSGARAFILGRMSSSEIKDGLEKQLEDSEDEDTKEMLATLIGFL